MSTLAAQPSLLFDEARRRQRRRRATIAGQRLALDWWGDQRIGGDLPRTAFDGYLEPARIIDRLPVHPHYGPLAYWDGSDAPSPAVWVLIDYGHGRRALTHLPVILSAGWG